MKFIECQNVCFCYSREENKDCNASDYLHNKIFAVDNINFEVSEGEFIAVLGHNGSGKSTLGKILNGLLKPTSGKVTVNGLNSSDDKNIWEIRKNVGMVFQNPDNQIVATVVEEDVAFGIENIGIKSEEIAPRVKDALKAVDMSEYAKSAPHMLSGGQKQRVAIAGIIAMKPKCIIFDEATAMLDPAGRAKIIDIILDLNKKEKITIILITHFMEEALFADRIFVMEKGKFVMKGNPRTIFSDAEKIKKLGLDLPVGADIGYRLREYGFDVDKNIVYDDEIVNYVVDNIDKNKIKDLNYVNHKEYKGYTDKIIEVKNMYYVYNEGSVFERKALKDINVDIFKGEIAVFIGKTGSGKSTLVQTLNGLIKPTDGEVIFNKKNIWEKDFNIRSVRRQVGIVFQYPEHQLFEETVFKDAMFGPVNMGFSNEEARSKVIKAFQMVGIDEELFEKSPFELSGGQKRRAAIAGVIAMEPDVIILDEPTAGLDPRGRDEILFHIKNMRDEFNMTVVMISHSMEEVCEIADRIIVMNDGEILTQGKCEDVFSENIISEKSGIFPPAVNIIFKKIIGRGVFVPDNIYTVYDAVDFLKERL